MALVFARKAGTLASALPVGPLEVPVCHVIDDEASATAIGTCLVCPSTRSVVVVRVPPAVYTNRPLDFQVDIDSCVTGCHAAAVVRTITGHLVFEMRAPSSGSCSVPLSLHLTNNGWIARALILPATWANATSLTIVRLTLAGLPLASDSLPASIRVGYNHAPAFRGAVFDAAQAGDVAALQAALEAGMSTEEADRVRGAVEGWEGAHYSSSGLKLFPTPPCCREAALRSIGPAAAATSRPSARSWQRVPTRHRGIG